MEGMPTLLQQTGTGHFLCQGVFEGVFGLCKEVALVEEFRALEVSQAEVAVVLGQIGDGLQEGKAHLLADDRSALKPVLLLRRDQDGLGTGELFHAGCEMRRLPNRRVVHREVIANPVDHHLSNVQSPRIWGLMLCFRWSCVACTPVASCLVSAA
jgi:hypothetical protein